MNGIELYENCPGKLKIAELEKDINNVNVKFEKENETIHDRINREKLAMKEDMKMIENSITELNKKYDIQTNKINSMIMRVMVGIIIAIGGTTISLIIYIWNMTRGGTP